MKTATEKLFTKAVEDLIALLKHPIHAYDRLNGERKDHFHRDAKRVLRTLGVKLNTEFHVHSNKGGIAVSGEIYLNTEHLSVCFSQSSLGPDFGFYYRWEPDITGNGRSGANRWLKWEDLRDVEKCVTAFKQEMNQTNPVLV